MDRDDLASHLAATRQGLLKLVPFVGSEWVVGHADNGVLRFPVFTTVCVIHPVLSTSACPSVVPDKGKKSLDETAVLIVSRSVPGVCMSEEPLR